LCNAKKAASNFFGTAFLLNGFLLRMEDHPQHQVQQINLRVQQILV
jgi:hypothetical protein